MAELVKKERPSWPMRDWEARAIIEGRKTQKRFVVKGSDQWHPDTRAVKVIPAGDGGILAMPIDEFGRVLGGAIRCPYGATGDRLWGREAWGHAHITNRITGAERFPVIYRADFPDDYDMFGITGNRWLSSTSLTRADSRIVLEVTDVRVEQLSDISEADAQAEGCSTGVDYTNGCTYKAEFSDLWLSINGAGSWAANPWVWVSEFKRVMP